MQNATAQVHISYETLHAEEQILYIWIRAWHFLWTIIIIWAVLRFAILCYVRLLMEALAWRILAHSTAIQADVLMMTTTNRLGSSYNFIVINQARETAKAAIL
ncbi:hypothetical protein O6H91_06G042400 [Diphasiastrum complanatum]|uniref:Uncharacterized protein n=1 Tax=Diphasiastrum complanatum TaxID=34168 RepID=A0ACC2DD43_DIPCM|nr:hypothetical protein O6H91_06G042400 [Diphasiastrum complanatum]